MPADLRITDKHYAQLHEHLLAVDGDEHAALLRCGTTTYGTTSALLVQEVIPLQSQDMLSAGALHLSISPIALARVAKQAKLTSSTLALCHSHPFPGPVSASQLDLDTEAELCGRALAGRLAPAPVGALVLGPDGFDGRVWSDGQAQPLTRIVVLGARTWSLPEPQDDPSARVERQVRAWGTRGQSALQDAHVIIIGCGGTGSHVSAQLAHLGVRRITLIDNDLIEITNLSRIVGARPDDVGRAKVDVIARHLRDINPDIDVTTLPTSVLDVDPAQLASGDLLVCCTDSHGSRALLTEIGQQFLVPLIDLGVEIVPTQQRVQAGGGVRVLLPGTGCLHCAGTLDPALIREEYLSDEQRQFEQARGYLRGVAEPAPSVIALNGVVASLAVLEICQLLTGVLGSGKQRLLLRADARRLTTANIVQRNDCHICGRDGVFGRGKSDRHIKPLDADAGRRERPHPMSPTTGLSGRTLWRVTAPERDATLPDFVTPIDSGMTLSDDGTVVEVAGSRLSEQAASDLSRQLREIADARLAARAASREAYIR